MKKRIVFIITLVFLNLGIAFPQEKSDNIFGFTIGFTEYQVKEKVLNNIRNRGMFFSGGLFYEKIKEFSYQKFELYMIYNKLKSRYDPNKATIAVNLSLNYRYARKVKDIKDDFCFFLGGVIGLDSYVSFYDNWDDSHGYWLTSYYLGLDAILTYQTSDKSTLFMEFNTPVVALISRPPERILYKMDNPGFSSAIKKLHENLRLTSMHQHFVLNINLGYTFQYFNKFKQSIFWRFMYLNNDMTYSKKINILIHTLGISFRF